MRFRNSWSFFMVGVILLLSLTVKVRAVDYSLYSPSTIDTEFSRIETDHAAKSQDKKAMNVLIHPTVPFSIAAQYMEQERPISEENQKSLQLFAKSFNKPIVLDVYQYEILVRDVDGREYWLPIQESFREAFHQEYYKGCKLTLYLLISIIYEHKPLVLINEFWVK